MTWDSKTAFGEHDRKFIAFALNEFGGGGPVASDETLDFFGQEHIVRCLKRACESGSIRETARAQGRTIIGVFNAT